MSTATEDAVIKILYESRSQARRIKQLEAGLSRIAYDHWEDGLAAGKDYNMGFLKQIAIDTLKGAKDERTTTQTS